MFLPPELIWGLVGSLDQDVYQVPLIANRVDL